MKNQVDVECEEDKDNINHQLNEFSWLQRSEKDNLFNFVKWWIDKNGQFAREIKRFAQIHKRSEYDFKKSKCLKQWFSQGSLISMWIIKDASKNLEWKKSLLSFLI